MEEDIEDIDPSESYFNNMVTKIYIQSNPNTDDYTEEKEGLIDYITSNLFIEDLSAISST